MEPLTPHNVRSQRPAKESGLPVALVIHEGGDVDSFLALPRMQDGMLVLDLDDGRTIEADPSELRSALEA